MKSMLLLVPVAAVVASAAMAAPVGGSYGYQQLTVPQAMNDPEVRKADALHNWRAEELKLQTADGGTLTPQHAKYLQARLAAIRAGEY
jgi:opacity protein-like surface antigen